MKHLASASRSLPGLCAVPMTLTDFQQNCFAKPPFSADLIWRSRTRADNTWSRWCGVIPDDSTLNTLWNSVEVASITPMTLGNMLVSKQQNYSQMYQPLSNKLWAEAPPDLKEAHEKVFFTGLLFEEVSWIPEQLRQCVEGMVSSLPPDCTFLVNTNPPEYKLFSHDPTLHSRNTFCLRLKEIRLMRPGCSQEDTTIRRDSSRFDAVMVPYKEYSAGYGCLRNGFGVGHDAFYNHVRSIMHYGRGDEYFVSNLTEGTRVEFHFSSAHRTGGELIQFEETDQNGLHQFCTKVMNGLTQDIGAIFIPLRNEYPGAHHIGMVDVAGLPLKGMDKQIVDEFKNINAKITACAMHVSHIDYLNSHNPIEEGDFMVLSVNTDADDLPSLCVPSFPTNVQNLLSETKKGILLSENIPFDIQRHSVFERRESREFNTWENVTHHVVLIARK
eukprot:PhF_6_TR8497/c0_g1_i2/m.13295